MRSKRKREGVDALQEMLDRPWCFYCERDFDDAAVLQTHQREMHFRCETCNRRLNTASGLAVHTQQVHKIPTTVIKNAIPGREDPSVELFGVLGIPEELVQAHRQGILDGYYRRAAEFRAQTGNPLPGTVKHDPNKKGKREETTDELKARLAAHRAAKKAAKEAAAAGVPNGPQPTAEQSADALGNQGDDFIALPTAMEITNDAPPPAFQPQPYGYPPAYTPAAPMSYPPTSTASYATASTTAYPTASTTAYPTITATTYPSMTSAVHPPMTSVGYQPSTPIAYPQANTMPHSPSNTMGHLPSTTTAPPRVPRPMREASNPIKSSSISPPALGLPPRPSFDAPMLSEKAMKVLHQRPPETLSDYDNGPPGDYSASEITSTDFGMYLADFEGIRAGSQGKSLPTKNKNEAIIARPVDKIETLPTKNENEAIIGSTGDKIEPLPTTKEIKNMCGTGGGNESLSSKSEVEIIGSNKEGIDWVIRNQRPVWTYRPEDENGYLRLDSSFEESKALALKFNDGAGSPKIGSAQ